MKYLVIIFICVLRLCFECNAQKKAEKWIFGNNGAGLDFSCSPPYPISGFVDYYSIEGCASISDQEGNLLFYSEGTHVWNRDHIQMPNGYDVGITPECWGSSTQGCLIVPHPGNNNLYYLFTIDCTEVGQYLEDQGFRYSIIDMSLENGMGNVTEKAVPIFDSSCEKLAAVFHQDGQSVWVVIHEYGTDAFRAYLVNENGLNTEPIISHQGVVQVMYDDLPSCWGISSKRGYMKFSPDGEKLVVVSASDCHPYIHPVQMFQFNNSSGEILLSYTLDDPDSIRYYGASFSPDGNLLYLSNSWYGYPALHQFDVSIADSVAVLNSKVSIYEWTEEFDYRIGGMQIGPDGKIYISQHDNTVGVIHYPNTYGTDCSYEHDYIFTPQCPQFAFSEFGLPNFIESYFLQSYQGQSCAAFLESDFGFGDPAIGEPVQFTDYSSGYPVLPGFWSWNFDDPDSGIDNTSSEQNPTHVFNAPGVYDVTLTVISDTSVNWQFSGTPCMIDSVTIPITLTVNTQYEIEPVSTWNAWFNSNQLIVKTSSSTFDLYIYDVAGRLVTKEILENKNTIDCANLASGVYLLHLKSGEENFGVKKILKSD